MSLLSKTYHFGSVRELISSSASLILSSAFLNSSSAFLTPSSYSVCASESFFSPFFFPRQALQHRCHTRSERHSACFLPNQAEPDRLPTVVQVLLLRHQAVFFRLKSVNMRSQAEPVHHFFSVQKVPCFRKVGFRFLQAEPLRNHMLR